MIVDWNRQTLKPGQVFHFKNSLRPFIEIRDSTEEIFFLDFNEMKIYTFDELQYDGLNFYEDEDDEDFKGVELNGEVRWVDD